MTSTFLGIPAPRGVGHLRGGVPFPDAARDALADSQLRRNLGHATRTIRNKRLSVVGELDDWEGHDPEVLRGMLESLARLREQGLDVIED